MGVSHVSSAVCRVGSFKFSSQRTVVIEGAVVHLNDTMIVCVGDISLCSLLVRRTSKVP